jgi:hypothetical protein
MKLMERTALVLAGVCHQVQRCAFLLIFPLLSTVVITKERAAEVPVTNLLRLPPAVGVLHAQNLRRTVETRLRCIACMTMKTDSR